MRGYLSDIVDQCQEKARFHFGLSTRDTYQDAIRKYHDIPPDKLTAEDNRCMNYLILAMLEKLSGASQEAVQDIREEWKEMTGHDFL